MSTLSNPGLALAVDDVWDAYEAGGWPDGLSKCDAILEGLAARGWGHVTLGEVSKTLKEMSAKIRAEVEAAE